MEKYDPLKGVPVGWFYLEETISFADFEVEHKAEIRYVSENKQELVDLCRDNDWPCPDVGNDRSGWYTYNIKKH
jgi:hypothetical protein